MNFVCVKASKGSATPLKAALNTKVTFISVSDPNMSKKLPKVYERGTRTERTKQRRHLTPSAVAIRTQKSLTEFTPEQLFVLIHHAHQT